VRLTNYNVEYRRNQGIAMNMLSSSLTVARDALATITPLRKDCGSLCGAACCQPDENGHGGMVLFPGEELLYQCCDWATLAKSEILVNHKPLFLLTCDGHCPRAERPLACRIFPLTPYAKNDRLHIIKDPRAWPICPLMPSGIGGLSSEFVQAVQKAMHALWKEDAHRAYMVELSRIFEMFQRFS
jgi:hypothetical protein